MSITKEDVEHALAANNEVLRAELVTKADLKANNEVLRAELVTKADLKANNEVLRAELVSKADLAANNEVLRAELASKADVENAKHELRAEIQLSEARTHGHVDHATRAAAKEVANVMLESFREHFGALDDKLQAHIDDESVHVKRRRR